MLGYAHVLAHADTVMLWDFGGHGANAAQRERFHYSKTLILLMQPLRSLKSIRRAWGCWVMGSGAVMSTGIRNPDRFAATVAVSPTGAAVTPQVPRNLQLQAGSWEAGFVTNAKRLLVAAGGE